MEENDAQVALISKVIIMGNITKPKHANVNNINRQLKLINSQLTEIKNSARRSKKFFNESRNRFNKTGVVNKAELNVVMKIPQYLYELMMEMRELEQLQMNLKYKRMMHGMR
jgi:hypothetical protein